MAISIPYEPVAELCRMHGVTELALFGSALRDDFRAESDVDLLVSFADEKHVSYNGYMDLHDGLEAILRRKIDLVPKSTLKPLLRQRILATAKLIYANR
jgi:uncharacterized protein